MAASATPFSAQCPFGTSPKVSDARLAQAGVAHPAVAIKVDTRVKWDNGRNDFTVGLSSENKAIL
jgi:hypothetical protein